MNFELLVAGRASNTMSSSPARQTKYLLTIRAAAITVGIYLPYPAHGQGTLLSEGVPKFKKSLVFPLPAIGIAGKSPVDSPDYYYPHQYLHKGRVKKQIDEQQSKSQGNQSIIQLIHTIPAPHETCQLFLEITHSLLLLGFQFVSRTFEVGTHNIHPSRHQAFPRERSSPRTGPASGDRSVLPLTLWCHSQAW